MSQLVFFEGAIDESAAFDEIRRLWAENVPLSQIAEATGVSSRRIDHLRALGKLVLPTRGLGGNQITKSPPRPPSPSEIRRRAAAVRRRWSREEALLRRAGGGTVLSRTALENSPEPPGRQASQRGVSLGVASGRAR